MSEQIFTSEKWWNSILEIDDGREELLYTIVLGGNKITGLNLNPVSPNNSDRDCSKKLDYFIVNKYFYKTV